MEKIKAYFVEGANYNYILINANRKWFVGGVDDQVWGDINLNETKRDTGELNIENIIKGLDEQFKIVGISSTELEYDEYYQYIPEYDGYTIDDIDKYLNYETTSSGDLLPKGHDEEKLYLIGSYEVE